MVHLSVAPLAGALLAIACLPACSPSHGAMGVPSDRSGGRIIIGRLVVDGAPASDWVGGGAYSGAELVVDDHITVRDDRVALESTSMGAPGTPFTSIGAKGAVTVRSLKLFRDIYYTRNDNDHSNPNKADIYYVQPGHYMCLGDNSAQSSDSRMWGVVPERLMLGKAVFVFFPFYPVNRTGFIK